MDTKNVVNYDNQVIFDERGTERHVGWYIYSDGTKKPIYEKTIFLNNLDRVTEETYLNLNAFNLEKNIEFRSALCF